MLGMVCAVVIRAVMQRGCCGRGPAACRRSKNLLEGLLLSPSTALTPFLLQQPVTCSIISQVHSSISLTA